MRFPRTLALTLGPVLLIGLCYVVAAPSRPITSLPPDRRDDIVLVNADELHRRCRQAADVLRTRSPSDWSVIVQPPFVLAGDIPQAELKTLYHQTVMPTSDALQIDYFDRDSAEPITLLLFSTDDSYRAAMQQFGHARREEYAGLYLRDERTVILNLSTGAGTLAHELTHALAHADFPHMPEWFDEGLASLHEESEFTMGGRRLVGRDNWRLRFLQEADQRECWKPLGHLFDRPFAEPDVAALDYALARYLCLYLQEQGVLPAYYRKCRDQSSHESSGRHALLRLFSGQTLTEIDEDFRTWVRNR